jgi:hypothetical protein
MMGVFRGVGVFRGMVGAFTGPATDKMLASTAELLGARHDE